MATGLVTAPVVLEHDTGPGHPERPERVARSLERLAESGDELLGLRNPLAGDAHAGGHLDKSQLGFSQIQLRIGAVRFNAETLAVDVDIVLQDAVLAIGKDDEHDR